METSTPRYAPGDEVILMDPANGWDDVPVTVAQAVVIAPLPHQNVRYLYIVHLRERDSTSVYAPEEALRPAHL